MSEEVKKESQEVKMINKSEAKATVAFICGLLSLVFCTVIYVSVVHAVLAIVFGALTKKHSKAGKNGFVLRNCRHISMCRIYFNNVVYFWSIKSIRILI